MRGALFLSAALVVGWSCAWGDEDAKETPAPPAAPAERFDLELKSIGAKKIAVIREVRARAGLGLAQTKALVERAPTRLGLALSRSEAEAGLRALEQAGAAAAIVAPASAAAAEEWFDLTIERAGEERAAALEALQALTGLSREDAAEVLDAAPTRLGLRLQREKAEEARQTLQDAGVTAAITSRGPEPDFDALADAAFASPATDRAALEELWGALYQHDAWHVLLRPTSELPDPEPVVREVDGKLWVQAFTSTDRLQAWAKEQGLATSEGGALLLTLRPRAAADWLARLGEAGLHGVRFNDGAHGWYAPVAQLEPIRAHLVKQGRLGKAPPR